MHGADDDGLSEELKWRLRHELDAIPPRISSPRYREARRPILWRLAPAALAAGLVGFLAVSGYAETGSTNPAVWRDRAVNLVRPANPNPESDQSEKHDQPAAAPARTPQTHASPGPDDRNEPNESHDSQDSSESGATSQTSNTQSGGGSGSDGGSSAESSPTPGAQSSPTPGASPSPGDH